MESMRDFLGKIKALLSGKQARPAPRAPHPMDCAVCGGFGMHPIRREFRINWYCESCYPPFLRRNGELITAGGPR